MRAKQRASTSTGKPLPSRVEVRAQVLDCTACDLHNAGSGPVPFSGSRSPDVLVVGEAATSGEEEPFTSASGSLLRRAMRDVGLTEDRVAWMYACSCVASSSPTSHQLNACSKNRTDVFELVGPSVVLLAGNTALRLFRPDLRIGKAHGRPFVQDERVFVPIYNPEAVRRNPGWHEELSLDLKLAADIVVSKKTSPAVNDWRHLVPETCVWCEADPETAPGAWHWDNDGIPYCERHWRGQAI